MEKIGFVCAWGKDKKKSWSGTNWGLYLALQRFYDVVDIDTGEVERNRSVFNKGIRKIKKIAGLSAPDMSLSHIKSMESEVEKRLVGVSFPLFQFEELPYSHAGQQYIYIDLHAGYVKKMHDALPDVFKLSAYQNVPEKNIVARVQNQDSFFEHVAGIFTMGHWLERELTEEYHIPKAKVCHVGGALT